MNRVFFVPFVALLLSACQPKKESQISISSPDGLLQLDVLITPAGQAAYTLSLGDKVVIDTSTLGFTFRDVPAFGQDVSISKTVSTAFDETWEMPWGEQRLVRNHYRQLTVTLTEQQPPARSLDVVFRVYDDGIGFRYEFPQWPGIDTLIIMDEHTQFKLTGNHTVWWTPGDWDIYEHLYNTTAFTDIDAISKRNHGSLAQTYIPENAVNTPVTMRTDDGIYLSFHEAALLDYAGMTLKIDKENLLMESELVGSDRLGWKVQRGLPFHTPWRTLQIAKEAPQLIESKLIVNLNEPNCLGDVSWVKPMKYIGIWWDMHIGTKSWDMASGRHGATTEYAKQLIDFAAANNIGGLLVEGWNTGWEHWIGFEDREGVFDFVTPYPDYDLEEVVRYGKEKGVEIVMHHETSAAPRTYEQQLDTAFNLMKRLGIAAVKTGYVGKIIPKGEYHHGQWMVNHYHKVETTAAGYGIAVNAHEPIKDTGLRRTWPNIISREGLRGQEFNAWSSDGGNPPEHLSIVAFTRMLAGPIDFTPGIFHISLKPYKENNQINTTLAHQLALYVVIYSPIQMAADLIQHYEGHPAFQFIRDVAVDWEQTKVLQGEPGDFVTIARQERGGDRWFVGSITDENPRDVAISLSFLNPDATYEATMYLDGPDAHYRDNPIAYRIETRTVTAADTLELKLAAGGGVAIELEPR